jgi:hypothetical protein
MGPLAWTPTLTLRDAGVDSNVFNSPEAEIPKQDVTGTLTPAVDSVLTLGVMQLATQGRADFLYFERYTNERAINGRIAGRMQFPTTRVHPVLTGSWEHAKERNGNEIDIRAPRKKWPGWPRSPDHAAFLAHGDWWPERRAHGEGVQSRSTSPRASTDRARRRVRRFGALSRR